MSKRAKPFPWLLIALCALLISLGFSIAPSDWFTGGFAFGFGLGTAIFSLMVWASPMNAANRGSSHD